MPDNPFDFTNEPAGPPPLPTRRRRDDDLPARTRPRQQQKRPNWVLPAVIGGAVAGLGLIAVVVIAVTGTSRRSADTKRTDDTARRTEEPTKAPKSTPSKDAVAAQTKLSATRPDPKPSSKPVPKMPDTTGVVEWRSKDNELGLYSDNLIPVLYGVPKDVVGQIPPEQLALLKAIEQLGADANKAAAEASANPVLKGRLIDSFPKQVADFNLKWGGDPPVPPPNRPKKPLKGWVGQIRLGADKVRAGLGIASHLHSYTNVGVTDEEIAQGLYPPRSIYKSWPTQELILISIDTKVMSDAALGQFKGLKDGDWVKVDLPDAEQDGSLVVHLAGSFTQTPQTKAAHGVWSVRETGNARFKKPRTAEPVVRKLALGN